MVLHFAPEWNFAGIPAGAEDRFIHDVRGNRLGTVGTILELQEADRLGLADQWLGLDIRLASDRPGGWWCYPIETVSQSEGGFELVHQSVVVQPHWIVYPDEQGRWSVSLRLTVDARTSRRQNQQPAPAAAHAP